MSTRRTQSVRLVLPAAALLLALAGCTSSAADASSAAGTAAASPSASMPGAMTSDVRVPASATASAAATGEQTGSYIDYAAYESRKGMYDSGTVVLFFNASWCPNCRETVGNLEGMPEDIPADLTVVSVDYDASEELKQRYGVTTQHTFVQIDAAGNELAKWTGSVTADEIEQKTV